MTFLLETIATDLAGIPILALGWTDVRGVLLPAFLGAVLALLLASVAKPLLRRLPGRRRRAARSAGWTVSRSGGEDSVGPCRSVECGLQEFAQEVERRLDLKLDRLERLLREADRVLGVEVPAGGLEDVDPRNVSALPTAPSSGDRSPVAADTELGIVSSADREKVLALASAGKSPDAISEAVGLLRGEVDLILRLYGRDSGLWA